MRLVSSSIKVYRETHSICNAQLERVHRGLSIWETSITGAERISAGRLPYTWAGELDGIRIGAFRKQGHHNDFDIEQERPVIYVE
jgi:hypothetical protein